jgi:hypothetical protein
MCRALFEMAWGLYRFYNAHFDTLLCMKSSVIMSNDSNKNLHPFCLGVLNCTNV